MSKWTCPECGGTWDRPNLNEIGREVFQILEDVKICSRCCQMKLAEARIAELESAHIQTETVLQRYIAKFGECGELHDLLPMPERSET